MFTPMTLIRNKSEGSWSVCLYHNETKRRYWLDAYLSPKCKDVEVEWNQYIFYNTDSDDQARKEFQEDCDNFEEASSEVLSVLQAHGEVTQNYYGDWLCGVSHESWKEETIRL